MKSTTRPLTLKRHLEAARAAAHRTLKKLAAENASPWRLAAACVVGGALGATPFFGLHLVLCIAAAELLRLNKVVVYAAANISIPPIAPLIAGACIEVGSWVIRGHKASVDVEALRHGSPWKLGSEIFIPWVVGAPIVGGVIGAILGCFVYAAARARQTSMRAPEGAQPPGTAQWERAEREIRKRFASAPSAIRHYVTWKMRLDPAYRLVARGLPPAGHVVELGGGLGILAMLLTTIDLARRVTAIDWDATKVAHARAASIGLDVHLNVADMQLFAIPECDAVILLDVLHYVSVNAQRALLARIAHKLPVGGIVFVREADRQSAAGRWTRTLEQMAMRFGWNRSQDAPTFRPIADICADLNSLGFDAVAVDASASLYPGNALIRAIKRAGVVRDTQAVDRT